tara:strand:- start:6701 stop:7228 length:528 start_codon:yes stop_codon:yes gene_type:complete
LKKFFILKYLKFKNIPNILSFIRIILIIPIIIFLELKNLNSVWYLLLISGITDFLDGYFARRYNLITKNGSILDPLADKIIIIIPLIWLCNEGFIPYWSISLITLREFTVTAFRSSKKDGMPALKFGKYKTLFFFIALIILFSPFKSAYIVNTGLIIYWIGFLLNIISLKTYLSI